MERSIFASTDNARFLWIADLKRRRALRVAQSLGQAMGRLGFDEFEPTEKSDSGVQCSASINMRLAPTIRMIQIDALHRLVDDWLPNRIRVWSRR